jgi:hypothetical protein
LAVSPRIRRLVTPLADQIVYASTAYTDLKSTLNQQSNRLVAFSRSAAGPADERLRKAVRLLRPYRVPGVELVRVGGAHDGGYLMSPGLGAVDGAISLGVGPDVSWDLDVARRGVKVAMFDPTVRRLPTKVPNGAFYRIGVCGQTEGNARYRPLNDLVAMAGFPPGAELLLKMDVEGAEWPTISSMDGGLADYQQIVVEMHQLSRLADADRSGEILSSLQRLAATHVSVHVHANNYSRLLRFDDDWFPDAVEVSYLRRDLADSPSLASRIRSPLDVPSDPRVAEIDLEGILELPLDEA